MAEKVGQEGWWSRHRLLPCPIEGGGGIGLVVVYSREDLRLELGQCLTQTHSERSSLTECLDM